MLNSIIIILIQIINCVFPGQTPMRIKMIMFFVFFTITIWLIVVSVPREKRIAFFQGIVDLSKKWYFYVSICGAILIAMLIPIDNILEKGYSESAPTRQNNINRKIPPQEGLSEDAYRGNITYPKQFSRVSRVIHVEGYTRGLPQNFYVWLAIEYGGLTWPKEPVISPNSEFKVDIHEGGYPPNEGFKLSLYAVGPRGNREINRWIKQGRNTGNFPGISDISESTKLFTVEVALSKEIR